MDGIAGHTQPLENSVIPQWMTRLPFQQQSVLLLALRGPDGVRKAHPAKQITVAYRATMLRAAERGRFLALGEDPDTFMSLSTFEDAFHWKKAIKVFFEHVDELPHHYVAHMAHAAQIIAVHHPLELFRSRWGFFYACWCNDLHVNPETPEQMNERLSDFGKFEERKTRDAQATAFSQRD